MEGGRGRRERWGRSERGGGESREKWKKKIIEFDLSIEYFVNNHGRYIMNLQKFAN